MMTAKNLSPSVFDTIKFVLILVYFYVVSKPLSMFIFKLNFSFSAQYFNPYNVKKKTKKKKKKPKQTNNSAAPSNSCNSCGM